MSRMRKRILIWGSVVFVLFVLAVLAFPSVIWDGVVQREILVTVRDSSTYSPIRNAEVSYVTYREEQFRQALSEKEYREFLAGSGKMAITDERGEARLKAQFGAGGSYWLFFQTGGYVVSGELSVMHGSYLPARGMLANFLQAKRFPLGKRKLELTIYLTRKREASD